MKLSKKLFFLSTIYYLLSTALLGCATIKEYGRGLAGTSVKILEDTRGNALKKTFALDYNSCYADVMKVLKENKVYVYAEDKSKKLIAVYLSEVDTTPVGIFFTESSPQETLVEVSSPSTYAKETMANEVFIKDKKSQTENAEEGKKDAKKEIFNKRIN